MVDEALVDHERERRTMHGPHLDPAMWAYLTRHGARLYGNRGARLVTAPAVGGAYHLVEAGAIRHYRLSREGEQVTLGIARRDGVIFFVGRAPGVNELYCDHLEAVADGTLVFALTRARLRLLLPTHPNLAASLLDLHDYWLAEEQARITDFALHDTRTRLAHALARLAEEGMVTATHEELACLVGANREGVTRALCALRTEGLIRYGARRSEIIVPDPARLTEWRG